MDSTFLLIVAGSVLPVLALAAISLRWSPLLLFFLLLPVPLSIFGDAAAGNVSAADVVAGIALVTILGRSKYLLGTSGLAIIVFLAVAGFSSAISTEPREAVLGIGRMALVTLAPLLLFANARDPVGEVKRGLVVYCVATFALSLCSMFLFATQGIGASEYMFGINKNSQGPIFGSAVAIAFAALLTNSFKGRALVATYVVFGGSCVGLLLCLSRGGWVGTIVALVVVMYSTGRVKPAIWAAILFVPLMAALWSYVPQDTADYATDVSPDSYVLRTRFDAMAVVMDAFERNPILGVGVGLRRIVEPHNVLVLTLGESGIVGLAAFLVMVGAGFFALIRAMQCSRHSSAQKAVLLASLAVFMVYHVQTLIDVYWRRGVGAMSWACVGVAVAVLHRQVLPVPRPVPLRRHVFRPRLQS